MFPLVFGGVSSYGLLFPVMVAVPAIFLVWRLTRWEGLALVTVLLFFAAILSGGVVGAKLFSLATRDWQLAAGWRGELISGWRWSGLLLGLAVAVPLAKRYLLAGITLRRLGDVIGLTLALAMCFGRVVCFIAGCCVGGHGDSILHLSFAPGSKIWYQQLQSGQISSGQWAEPVLALQIPFFIASGAVAIFLYRFDSRRRYDGQVLLLFLALHESSKALLELLREPLIPAQLVAASSAGLIGILALSYLHGRSAQPSQRLKDV